MHNVAHGEVNAQTTFHYFQNGHILTGEYAGGQIIKGQLLGIVAENGTINMCYYHLNTRGELMSGTCYSTPSVLPNGKIRLEESWQWTCGNMSKGTSVVEEI